MARLGPRKTLDRRADTELPFTGDESSAGGPLLLDTCVYIDQVQGHSPAAVDDVIAARQSHHSTIALQELMHTVGVLDPKDRRTPTAIATIRGLILSMLPHRVFTPDSDTLGRAALLAGMICRLQGYGRIAGSVRWLIP